MELFTMSMFRGDDWIPFAIIFGVMIFVAMWVAFGLITQNISKNKGYKGGFAWGFFLGVIGIIVVACRPDRRNAGGTYYGGEIDDDLREQMKRMKSKESSDNDILRKGGWRCSRCNSVNPKYLTTCTCGQSLWDNQKYLENQQNANKAQEGLKAKEEKMKSEKEQLASCKQMFEEGIITQEEYEAKRKKILGI